MAAFITGSEAMLFEIAGSTPTTNGSNTGTLTSAGGNASINDSSNFNTSINGGTSNGTVTIGNSAAGAITIASSANVAITTATASTWAATGGLTFSAGAVTFATASAGTYGATIALVVASNKVTIAGVNGTSATFTLNCAAVAPAGRQLIVETTASGGTVTGTFGTHFRTSGTQATTVGALSEILFIGDGTNWNEVARTTALA